MDRTVPPEAIQALQNVRDALGDDLIAVYLYGSAVAGGLRRESDVDIMAVVRGELTECGRKALAERLLDISGKMGNGSVRPLEVTVVSLADVVPWRYPPRKQFIYGEWLRNEYELGKIPEPSYDPDLAILLSQIRQNSIPLFGPEAKELLDAVPEADLRRAMRECIPSLIGWVKGDERNVLLTFARIWVTAVTGLFLPKDKAACWAAQRLPGEQADLLIKAGQAYLGEYTDHWESMDTEVAALAHSMLREIEAALNA